MVCPEVQQASGGGGGGGSEAGNAGDADEEAAGGRYELTAVEVVAGCTLRFDVPVVVKKGCKVRFEFWIDEIGRDIKFSVLKEGAAPLVFPYFDVYDSNNHCGPVSFVMEEDSLLTFVWDNSHAWYQSKTVTYWIEVGSEAAAAVVPAPGGVDIQSVFGENFKILGPTEQKLAALLIGEGKSDFFSSWPAPSTESDLLKHAFFRKAHGINTSHPGGLVAWVQAGRALPDFDPAAPPAAASAAPPASPGIPVDLV
jgi:hypothetical protein